jgi:signal transduction histidine kinase
VDPEDNSLQSLADYLSGEIEFRMAIADDRLKIDVADNGKGLGSAAPHQGHGLKNLSARLLKLGGSCVVQSGAGDGTVVKIRLPLAVCAEAGPTPSDQA